MTDSQHDAAQVGGSPLAGSPQLQHSHSLFRAKYVSEWAVGGLGIILILILSFTTENFADPGNLLLILEQTSTVLIVALPFALVLMTRYIDLSVGSLIAVFAVVAANLMGSVGSWVQWNPWIVSGLLLALGLAYGAGQGLLVTLLKFNPFVLSIGLLAALRGLAFVLQGDRYAEQFPRDFLYLGQGLLRGLNIPVSVLIAAAISVIAYFYLHSTRHGRHTQAIAGNAKAAFMVGIPVNRRVVLLYALLGASVALAALITASKLDSGPASIGNGFEVQILTAVLLGGVAFEGGRGTVIGVIIGAVFINLFNNGLLQWGVGANESYFLNGMILAIAAGLPPLSAKLASRRAAAKSRKAGAGA